MNNSKKFKIEYQNRIPKSHNITKEIDTKKNQDAQLKKRIHKNGCHRSTGIRSNLHNK